jgi:hypothetical protein
MPASKHVRARYAAAYWRIGLAEGSFHSSRCSGGARDLTVPAVSQATVRCHARKAVHARRHDCFDRNPRHPSIRNTAMAPSNNAMP